VLEHGDEAARAGHAQQLLDEAGPRGGVDMVQDADRERDLEGAVLVRQAAAVVRAVAPGGVAARGLLDQPRRDVDSLQPSGERAEMAMDEAEAAADVERPDVLERAQLPACELEQDACLRLEEEVVLASGKRDRRVDLLLVRPAIAVEAVGYGDRSSRP
jgi:hypothetical protein